LFTRDHAQASGCSAREQPFIGKLPDRLANGRTAETKLDRELAFSGKRMSGVISMMEALANHLHGKSGLGIGTGHAVL
jgi:hypothetical protein